MEEDLLKNFGKALDRLFRLKLVNKDLYSGRSLIYQCWCPYLYSNKNDTYWYRTNFIHYNDAVELLMLLENREIYSDPASMADFIRVVGSKIICFNSDEINLNEKLVDIQISSDSKWAKYISFEEITPERPPRLKDYPGIYRNYDFKTKYHLTYQEIHKEITNAVETLELVGVLESMSPPNEKIQNESKKINSTMVHLIEQKHQVEEIISNIAKKVSV